MTAFVIYFLPSSSLDYLFGSSLDYSILYGALANGL